MFAEFLKTNAEKIQKYLLYGIIAVNIFFLILWIVFRLLNNGVHRQIREIRQRGKGTHKKVEDLKKPVEEGPAKRRPLPHKE